MADKILILDILINYIDNIPVRNTITGVRIVDQRSKYLNSTNLLGEAAFDKYTFIRDAYIQRRRNRIYDGNPPLIDEDDDVPDEFEKKEESRVR